MAFAEAHSGPAPILIENSTPAASRARRTARSFATVIDVSLSVVDPSPVKPDKPTANIETGSRIDKSVLAVLLLVAIV